jgi:flagellar biosynthesis/type III secretory pathway protein FliH
MVHNFQHYDAEHSVSLDGRIKIITIELSKAPERLAEGASEIEELAFFLRYGSDPGKTGEINALIAREEGIKMAASTLAEISQDENERARLLTLEKNLLDYQSGIISAERRGMQQGMQQGIQQGMQQGIQQGLQQGIDEVLNLLKQGLNYSDILKQMGR